MKPNDIVYAILKSNKTTQGELAAMLKPKVSTAAISNRLNRDAMTTEAFLEMVNALGYELVVRPKNPTDVRTEYTVTIL